MALKALEVDESLLRVARTCAHNPAREQSVRYFSMLGEHAGIWLVLGAAESLLSSGERRSRWARATGVVAGAYVVNTALKLTVRRVRPRLPGLPALTSTPTRFSFPSAHSSTSFAGALAFSRAGLPAPPLYALALGFALSRLYLGVHYPSDVLAGALLGLAIAEGCTRRAGASSAMGPTGGLWASGEQTAHGAGALGVPVSPGSGTAHGASAA